MHVYKIITTTLDIQNTISLYTDINNNVLNILIKKFENRCYSGCFILKVLTIERLSECTILQCNESGNGSLDVQFRAYVIELYPEEIIFATVLRNDAERKMIIATNEYTALNVMTNNVYDSIRETQIIPVRIKQVMYSVGKEKIQAFAMPYKPSRNVIGYNCNGIVYTKELHDKFMNIAKDLYEMIEEDFSMKELNPASVKFFNNLVYPFKTHHQMMTNEIINETKVKKGTKKTTNVNSKSSTSFNILSIEELVGQKLNILTRPSFMNLLTSSVYNLEQKELDNIVEKYSTDVVKTEINIVMNNDNFNNDDKMVIVSLLELLTDILSHRKLIKDFIENIDSKGLNEQHLNLWKILQSTVA